jgi:hypothetical protein
MERNLSRNILVKGNYSLFYEMYNTFSKVRLLKQLGKLTETLMQKPCTVKDEKALYRKGISHL